MLDSLSVPYRYREYTREPLSEAELRDLLRKLGVGAKDILRSRDARAQG